MMYLIGILITIFLVVIIVQIGKVNELTARLRGEKQAAQDGNDWNAKLMLLFMVAFLVGSVWSAIYYKDYMLGYGPNLLASEHAVGIQFAFNITLFFTGIVFVITQILLFVFSYMYRYREDRKAEFISHDNKLEIVWTAIPAFVMALLVVLGLVEWNKSMADVGENEKPVGYVSLEESDREDTYLEIEATGKQFGWILRHPGKDGKLGEKDYTLIDDATNELGLVFDDPKNIDDIVISDELVLPVGQKIRARITSRDVLHNFDIPHFYVKMDAIPGIPTHFVFTPTMTTESYRDHLSQFPEWNVPADPDDPEGPKRWEAFEYELACAELCGKGHYSMRRIVRVVTLEEYNEWLTKNEEKSFYLTNVRGKLGDPFINKKLSIEERIDRRNKEKDAEKKKDDAPAPDAAPSTTPATPETPTTPETNTEGNTLNNSSSSENSNGTTTIGGEVKNIIEKATEEVKKEGEEAKGLIDTPKDGGH